MKKSVCMMSVALAAGTLVVLGGAGAWAGGYGPSSPTGPAGTPGGYTNVVVTRTVGTGGGSVTASVAGVSLNVQVPAGDFSAPVQVELTSPNLGATNSALSGVGFAGYTAVTGIGVKILDANGTPVTGNFTKPIVLTLTGPGLGVSGEKVLMFTGPSGAQVVPATLGTRQVTVTLNQDPNLVVVNPTSTAAGSVPGATTKQTGLPFTGETDLALALLAGGVVLAGVGVSKARRRTTAS